MVAKMKFKGLLSTDKFIITAELFPPKGTDLSNLFKKAEMIKPYIDALNVTDSQRAIMRISSLAVSGLLRKKGFEPIWQISCRDRNRIALQGDILGASALGIENVLVISGDHPRVGDHPEALPVYDLDTVQLIQTIKTLENGKDLAGNSLKGQGQFCVGAAVNPFFEPVDLQIKMMEKKIKMGADFFQTQPVFDVDQFKIFLEKVKPLKPKILAGIFLVPSVKVVDVLEKMGTKIPSVCVEQIKKAKNPLETGIKLAVEIISQLKSLVKGVHLMSMGKEEYIPEIIKTSGLKKP